MKISKEQATINREKILDVGSRLFRQRGFDGIGVADLMKAAEMTHGGFYNHFDSKEELMAKATDRALAGSLERWSRLADDNPANPLKAIATAYLSEAHRDHPGSGCALSALCSDVSRQADPVRHSYTEGLRSLADLLARLIPSRSRSKKREKALVALSGWVGALLLSRAVDDPALSDEILKAALDSLR